MENIKSDLVFERYQVDKIIFKSNDEYIDDGKPIEIKYEINVHISHNDTDPVQHKVTLESIVFRDAENLNFPFTFEVMISGFFNCINISKEQVNNLININAVAILLPYLRATASSVTALTGHAALNLPLINVQKLYEKLIPTNPELPDSIVPQIKKRGRKASKELKQ